MATGKISRLPVEVREQLNQRLYNGERGSLLVARLNSLPSVRAVIEKEFGGKPVREQNLSKWRHAGYRDWLARQGAIEAVRRVNAEADPLREEPTGELTENFALWLTAQYMAAIQKMKGNDGSLDWKTLREFCGDIVAMRRGDHSAARLAIESKRQLQRRDIRN